MPDLRIRHLGEAIQTQNAGRESWEEAKSLVASFEAAGARDAPPAVLGPPVIEPSAPADVPATKTKGITIADAVDSFIANRQNRGIEQPTLAKIQNVREAVQGVLRMTWLRHAGAVDGHGQGPLFMLPGTTVNAPRRRSWTVLRD